MSIGKFEISIVIPTYNGKEKVVSCLRSLENQSYTNFETIVVIDGSTDGTEAYLKGLQFDLKDLKIVFHENKGRAGVRNTGARLAKGDIVLFVDDDMRLKHDSVALHKDFHQKYVDSILVGNQIEDYELIETDFHKFKAYLSRKWADALCKSLKRLDKPFITAAHFSIPKGLFMDFGGFDEKLTDAEDYDLALRVFKEGIPVYFNPELIGWHDDLFTCSRYIQRQREYKKAHLVLRNKYPDLQNGVAPTHKLTFLKKLIFGYSFWARYIDAQPFFIKMLPQKIRFKLYDFVVYAQVQ